MHESFEQMLAHVGRELISYSSLSLLVVAITCGLVGVVAVGIGGMSFLCSELPILLFTGITSDPVLYSICF